MNQLIIDSWKKAPKYLNNYEIDTSLLYKNAQDHDKIFSQLFSAFNSINPS